MKDCSSLTAKSFLTKNFFYLFSLTSFFALIIGIFVSIVHLKSVQNIYVSKIKENIDLQRNEILNEIAMGDSQALQEHLNVLLKELDVDSVLLDLESTKIMAGKVKEESFDSKYGFKSIIEKNISIPLENEFSTIRARLSITFSESFSASILNPFLKVAFLLFIISLVAVGILFVILYTKVDQALIRPLFLITERLSGSTTTKKRISAENSISEIGSLMLASERFQEMERNILLSEIASQVSHDIRSPLSALNVVMGTLNDLPEEKRLIIRGVAQRINDIANQLLQKSKDLNVDTVSHSDSPVLLTVVLDAIISEKRIQYRDRIDIQIQGDFTLGYGLFSSGISSDLSRVISNLINNSIEAIKETGFVNVKLESAGQFSLISIEDNGKGMPDSILSSLGEKGISFGKDGVQSGFGMGISHAQNFVEKLGGQLNIQSRQGVGTQVSILLPKAATPDWFVSEIDLNGVDVLVSLDDEQSVHRIWSSRIRETNRDAAISLKLIKFVSIKLMREWMKANNKRKILFLVDYELLQQEENGLDVIESLQICKQSILVTSRFDEAKVKIRAARLGVKILPKALVQFIPIVNSAFKNSVSTNLNSEMIFENFKNAQWGPIAN